MHKEWKTNHASADGDAVGLVHGYSGGGVAWRPGMGDKNWGQAVLGGTGEFPTIVARHEFAHNWGAGDNHTNGPEGPTIESDNAYARFDGTELAAILARRDSRLDNFPADAQAYPVALPPYAALDLADGAFSGVPLTLRPSANDADANRDALTLSSVETTSHLGGKIVRSGNDVTYTPPTATAANTVDWFSYVVRDATGKTATGVVIARVSPNTALAPVAEWKAADVAAGVPYELVNRHTGLLAATPVVAAASGPLVQRAGTDAGTRFAVSAQGAGYRLRNVATDRRGDVEYGSIGNGARAGGQSLVNVSSDLCVVPAAAASGATLVQKKCGIAPEFRWSIVKQGTQTPA